MTKFAENTSVPVERSRAEIASNAHIATNHDDDVDDDDDDDDAKPSGW